MKKSLLLRAAGIIMIISAIVTLVFNIVAIVENGTTYGNEAGNVGAGIFVVFLMDAFPLLVNVLTLIAGIWGAKNWKTPQKAGKCVTIGTLILALNVASVALGVVNAGFTSTVIASMAFLLFPLLYLVGALQLRRSA